MPGVSGASDVPDHPKNKKGSYDYLDNSYPDNIGSYDYSYGYRYNNNHKVLMDIMYGYHVWLSEWLSYII